MCHHIECARRLILSSTVQPLTDAQVYWADASMNDSLSTSDFTFFIQRFLADLYLGAVLTNARASIRGAAKFDWGPS
jgi:hypothetical protein